MEAEPASGYTKGASLEHPRIEGFKWAVCDFIASEADLFAVIVKARYTLPVAEQNEYSEVYAESAYDQLQDAEPNEDDALKVLQSIDAASGTGPDGLSARVLKRCARALSPPFVMPARAVLHNGHWPILWE